MVAISSTASSARIDLASLPQLRRAVEQARETASALQAQAREAWAKVDRAVEGARDKDDRSLAATTRAEQTQQSMTKLDQGTSIQAQSQTSSGSSVLKTTAPTVPVINTQGQRTGTVVNITA